MTSGVTLFLYEDARARAFEPFAMTRPVATLMAGALPLFRRWEQALGATAAGIVGAGHLADFVEAGAPPVHQGDVPAGSILVNARFAPRAGADLKVLSTALGGGGALMNDGRVAAVRAGRVIPGAELNDGQLALDSLAGARTTASDVAGWWMDEVWDFVGRQGDQLASDVATMCASRPGAKPPDAVLVGSGPLAIDASAVMEPHVIVDTTAGPVVVEAGAHVHAGTKLIGPCYVGPKAVVLGGEIRGCAIGPYSKVRGEMSSSTILGYSNKSHDGFVGHSYLGRWVNLGAGTITSNLKNTYGTVALWTPAGTRDTGLQFLGTLFGDHVKTGIGLRLTTGCVIGAAANVYGAMPPKAVAPFAWGGGTPYTEYHLDKFLQTAERAMARRNIALDDRARRHLTAVHAARWTL